jgi:glycerol kinase
LLARAAGADLGAPLSRLRVDGGLTRSRTLLQVQADLLQAPVEVYPSPHATALGVAMFAARGAGLGEASADGGAAVATDVVEPRMDAGHAEQVIATWQAVAEATMAVGR